MAMSTFQKVTLATCLVLCVALLLPKMLLSRGRKDAAERPEGSGRAPPMVHRQAAPEGRGQKAASAGYSRSHSPDASTKAKGTGIGTGGKSNLAGQIIPVYGFGILFYILYILFKITSKGHNKPSESRFPSARSENKKRKITDFELSQLQEKLRETELVMENIVSNAQDSPSRVKGVMADQEKSLLQQLTEITRVMQEGQLMEGMTPEKKTQDNWEDYPEEPQQQDWEHSPCCCQHSEQHHSPHTETEADRTEAAEGDLLENVPAEEVAGEAEAQEAEAVTTDAVRESDLSDGGEEDAGPQNDLAANEREELNQYKEPGGQIDLGVPEKELAGVLKELELTLQMTTMMEQEKVEDLTRPVETEPAQSQVRRRNKRRSAKKAAH
ncbi:protein RIC-3b isoform X1 [Platichthys flesus]|uniref:protein RIC-3b isoform X1 n=2 Tax=Platichthys flesus TaxID=8260 RepID=UPI002DB7C71A|nr:protein RIC-3b isoform X1 [Platichthys flesus]